MITYTEFNRWCYNYYIHHNKDSEYGSLFIPPSDIDEFLGRDNAQDPIIFSEINNDWSYFLKTDKSENAIIKVFGIIALQCYAAYLMENDNINSKNEYRARLIKLLNIVTPNEKDKYGEGQTSTQDKIWKHAREFLKKDNIIINIPSERSGAGRYTQYPRSQVIFNKEDLKGFRSLLTAFDDQMNSDVYSFEKYFNTYVVSNNQVYFNKLLIRYNVSINQRTKDYKILIKQLYNYYLSKEWQNTLKLEIQKRYFKRKSINNDFQFAFYVYHDPEDEMLELYLSETDNQDPVTIEKIINLSVLNETEAFLFESINSNSSIFEYTTYVTLNQEYFIISHSESDIKHILENKFNLIYKQIEGSDFSYVLTTFIDERIFKFFHEKTENIIISPLSVSGKRIDFRKRIYLKGYDINIKINVDFLKELKLHKIVSGNILEAIALSSETDQTALIDLSIGSYEIFIGNNFTNYKFDVVAVDPLLHILKSNYDKLNTSTLRYSNNENGIHGVLFHSLTERSISVANIRDILVKNKKVDSDNLILKSLNQYKHGRN